MPSIIPTTVLPDGNPTYQHRRGKFVWPARQGPTLLIHHDFDLLWVTSGRAALKFSGGVQLTAGQGEFFLLPPLTAATISQLAPPLVFWFCHFDFRAATGRAAAAVVVPLKIKRDRGMGLAAAYAALNAISDRADHSLWRRESALIEMALALAKLGKHSPADNPRPPSFATVSDPRVASLRARIEAAPASRWRVAELARSVDLSPGHLHALWVIALGCGIKQYILRARLRRAMALLRGPDPSRRVAVKKVAAACGFSSQHQFCRQFRQSLAVTPTAFRDSSAL